MYLLTYAADLLLVTASLGAALYCMILSRRLKRLGSFDKGIGSAIAVLSAQVEEMKVALGEAKAGSDGAGRQLNDLVLQAQDISAELEMMIAACHDFAETAIQVQTDASPSKGGKTAASEGAVMPHHPAEDAADRALSRAQEAARSKAGDDRRADLPVFGSRRTTADQGDASDDTIPLFRRRTGSEG